MAKFNGNSRSTRQFLRPSYIDRQSGPLWFGNLLAIGLRFALNVLIARLAGADQMGVYIALAALTFVIARIADLGLPNAVVYFVRSQTSATRRCVWVCVIHSVCTLPASILLLLLAGILGLASEESGGLIDRLWLLLGALSTIQQLSTLLGQLLIPLNRFREYAFVVTISPLVTVAACLTLGEGMGASQVLAAVLMGETCAAVLGLTLVLHAAPTDDCAETPPGFSTIYRYAIRTYVGTSIKALSQRADRLILSWIVPSALLAAYAVAVSLRDNALLPFTTHSMLLRNELISRAQRTDAQGATAHLKGELVRWSILAGVIAVVLALAAPFLLPIIYGDEFRSAVPVFVILSGTLPMIAIAMMCWTSLLSAGKPDVASVGLTFSGLLNLAALYTGAHIAGIVGACWGALIVSIVAAGWWLVASFKR